MALKVNFEIGHEASIRTKKTHELFTHDWEVFVRGIDGADISHFVEKVVFHLHESFPKPKRVLKEPPYSVKESGYAGFNFPIEIYLKNRDEPKKIPFTYDLYLQPVGPPISRVRREKFVFSSPSEEFRRKLIKGGATSSNSYHMSSNMEHERNSRDSFTDEKPSQLIGKPKFAGENLKKHKPKDYRTEELPRPSNNMENIFGSLIYKNSKYSPDHRKPSPNPKTEKKDKEKSHSDREKTKLKHESKEKDHREEKKSSKEDKDRIKEDKKSKTHKDRDATKEKNTKRPAEKPPSPLPPAKRPTAHPSHSPRRAPSPSNKSNSSTSSKDDVKSTKNSDISDIKNKPIKLSDNNIAKSDKKIKKEKKSHDKERDIKKEHKKEKEIKANIPDNKLAKPKEILKEPIKENLPIINKEKEKPIPKPTNKFTIANMLKDPTEVNKYPEPVKHKEKLDRERKHKHKKKDKKREELRENNKDSMPKDKKHKHDKHKEKLSESKESLSIPEKPEPVLINREPEKMAPMNKTFKEKDRSLLTISPISLDTSSQSSSKSGSKTSIVSKTPLNSLIEALSNSESEHSMVSDNDDHSFNLENTRISKVPNKPIINEPPKQIEPKIPTIIEPVKIDKAMDKIDKSSNHRIQKNKDKMSKQEAKEDKKQRKRKTSSKGEDLESISKITKITEDVDHLSKNKRNDIFNNPPESSLKMKSEFRSKSDTKVQDDGVSSSLSDNPLKCESPINEDDSQINEHNEISPDYMMQLQELQQRIMTIQSTDELERVVNLIAETGKYEVTKKTFDFDLCLLDRTTVQQLQELIGCESTA